MLFSRKQRALARMKELAGVSEPPAFSRSVSHVLDELRDPEFSMDEIAEAVAWDPGLVVRLLKLVNSAAFGLRRQVDSSLQAVKLLGRSNLESLLLGLAVEQALPAGKAPGFDPKAYWRASAQRASLARILAERLEPAGQAAAFTVGLLQDLAVPVLAHARHGEYGGLLERWRRGRTPLSALEQEAFGWDHAELGAAIGDAWELPEQLVAGIRDHHDPQKAGAAVHLVGLVPEGADGPQAFSELVETARTSYGLAPDWTLGAVERARGQAEELVRLFG